jgi:hypothetical protein
MNRPTCFAGVALAALLAGCSSSLEDDDDASPGSTSTSCSSPATARASACRSPRRSSPRPSRCGPPRTPACASSSARSSTARAGRRKTGAAPARSAATASCAARSPSGPASSCCRSRPEASRRTPASRSASPVINCVTLTPLNTPEDRPTLQVAVQPIDEVPDRSTIELRFHIATSSILFADEQRQEQLIAALAQQLAPAGIVPRLASDARARRAAHRAPLPHRRPRGVGRRDRHRATPGRDDASTSSSAAACCTTTRSSARPARSTGSRRGSPAGPARPTGCSCPAWIASPRERARRCPRGCPGPRARARARPLPRPLSRGRTGRPHRHARRYRPRQHHAFQPTAGVVGGV